MRLTEAERSWIEGTDLPAGAGVRRRRSDAVEAPAVVVKKPVRDTTSSVIRRPAPAAAAAAPALDTSRPPLARGVLTFRANDPVAGAPAAPTPATPMQPSAPGTVDTFLRGPNRYAERAQEIEKLLNAPERKRSDRLRFVRAEGAGDR